MPHLLLQYCLHTSRHGARFFDRRGPGKGDAHAAFSVHVRLTEQAQLGIWLTECALDRLEAHRGALAFNRQRAGRRVPVLYDHRSRQAENRAQAQRELRQPLRHREFAYALASDVDGATLLAITGYDCDVMVRSDRRILTTGRIRGDDDEIDTFVARLHPDGTRDASFAGNGLLRVDAAPGEEDSGFRVAHVSGRPMIAGAVGFNDPLAALVRLEDRLVFLDGLE